MFKEIFSWFYSKDFSFWQNMGHIVIVLALLLIGAWSFSK